MQLTFDPDVESFRAEFVAFLDEHVPATAAEALERPKSVSHMPDWARRWQRLSRQQPAVVEQQQIGRASCRERV